MTHKTLESRNGTGKHLDNHRIFRPQAVEAYSTRQAGDPWGARPRFEGWIIAGLTLMAAVAAAMVFLGGR
jgi:hypothetical protein